MNKADRDRVQELCSRISVEHDHKKFLAFVEELNRILSARDQQLEGESPDDQKYD